MGENESKSNDQEIDDSALKRLGLGKKPDNKLIHKANKTRQVSFEKLLP